MTVIRFTAKVNSNGTISIPKKLRESEQIEYQDELILLFQEKIGSEAIVFENEVKELGKK